MELLNKKEKIINSIKNVLNVKSTRRDFIKWMGYSTASVTLAACKGPVIKSIPYVTKPDDITLGIPTYYATTMIDSFDMSCVLVKTREGRPIKIEPNLNSKYFNTTSARIQSSILSLYDEERLKDPYLKGKKSNWKEIDSYIIRYLKNIKQEKKDIIFLSHSNTSYSTNKLIKKFKKTYPNTKWITYDAISYSKFLESSEKIFGIRGIPSFDLNEIELIISFDSDFLGDWSPENMGKNYVKNKNPKETMIKHIQIESNMTITGANADVRISKKPSEIKKMLIEVYNNLFFNIKSEDKYVNTIVKLINKKKSKSVIFSDGDQESYDISFLINKKIKSKSINKKNYIFLKNSNDNEFEMFINKLNTNNVGALFFCNVDPMYSLPVRILDKIKKNIKKIPIKVSFTISKNETSQLSDIIIPVPHWLESWGDTHPLSNYYTLIQPTINPIFNTRQLQDSLMTWINVKENNYYEFLKKIWEKYIIPKSNVSSFNEALFYGFVEKNNKNENIKKNTKLYPIYKKNYINNKVKKEKYLSFELRLYTKISMGDGSQYNNPWLQELPDPITRTTWDNYLTMSFLDAEKTGIKNWNSINGSLKGNCVNLIKNKKLIIKDLPVFIQPGQALGSIGLAFGYGQRIGKLCNGKNAYKLYENFKIVQENIEIQKTTKIHKFACIQLQNTTLKRNLTRETDINTFLKKPKSVWNIEENIYTNDNKNNVKKIPLEQISIWENLKKKNKKGHHFNLSIDLNSCIGCGSCVIACHSENNVPVVGKEEIINSRDMHWIRVDRYYFTNEKKIKNNIKKEKNYFYNPKVSFQPVMCQHCEYAPCETVCPVGATTHGEQGQNMMTYNRCVGTRYCANNCPYKVRRFNWFNYVNNKKFDFNMNNSLGRMILNPDVVVRSRGVMEKCSLCIQRTQYAIGIAKKENRTVKDKEFNTACSISCPTSAITFGDVNDKESTINKKIKNTRSYKLLDFLGVHPNVSYLLKIRNDSKNNDEK
ncbi:4Fe-4S dicluster domain-containing protein [Blattabacterium cuenoti]|uniref:4Fe-4S dicluster domain-containing protein n=1 Tax=Blattabacterium cuenoti TaxID=1653831 RepID=UPI00163BF40F|nr:4Fe-4S dicluster domain-containing protein [Blattabacterium cuenoti]